MGRTDNKDVAIVGMACVFPGAPDLESYWRNISNGVDAIREIPAERWDPLYHDPNSDAVDRFPVRRGGVIDAPSFDAVRWGVMPVAAQGAEPDQLMALEVGALALKDAGYGDGERDFDRGRTAVVLGRGNYIGAGMTRLEQHVRTSEQLVASLRDLVPGIGEEQLLAVKAEFQSKLGAYGGDTAIGLVPNLTASRMANRLDLQGPAYTVDGACASSLLAVDQARHELLSGRVNLALAGGVHLTHDVAFWSVFTQLQALSHKGQIRPFDKNADGLLPGEGLGIVALKRLADAERDGDRIYATVRSVGIASDGRGASLMVPRVEGQLLALERAWRAADLDPNLVGLVEAHGTATPVGDEAELKTLARFFGPVSNGEARKGLGSVKSMIGHAMPAAGAAGLIKTALALYHGTLPPTLHCDDPNPLMEQTCFRPIRESEPWDEERRVAAVNAFGFGGINAHVVAMSHGSSRKRTKARPGKGEEILLLAADTSQELIAALDAGRTDLGSGVCRLALVNPTNERRQKARDTVAKGKARSGRDGLWFSPDGLVRQGGKVAFLFPGVEAVFEDRVSDVAAFLGLEVPAEVLAAKDLEHQGVAIVHTARVLDKALRETGVKPDLMAGHSVGEWSGMIASGMIPEDALNEFVGSLRPGTLEVPGLVFGAVGASAERVREAIVGLDRVVVTHDNCPHQVILCGPEADVDEALVRLRGVRILGQKLPFQSGFHSPMFREFLEPHRDNFSKLGVRASHTPLWSATTCARYPEHRADIEQLALEHLVKPVRFRELTETLYDKEGVRVFVQLGGGSLVGFVSDTLRGRPHLAMSANAPQRSGMEQLRRVIAALFVEGVDVDWARIAPPVSLPDKPRSAIKLSLGVPLVHLETPLDIATTAAPTTNDNPVLAGFDEVMAAVGATQHDVRKAWQKETPADQKSVSPKPAPAKPAPKLPEEHKTTRRLSIENDQNLLDHCLMPQRPDWPSIADRNPVVPMTMMVRMMMEAAEAFTPGRVAIALENLLARKWLPVYPAVDLEIRCRRVSPERVRVAFGDYCDAEVVLAAGYPKAPAASEEPISNAKPSDTTAAQLYSRRWMFHGPAYQSVGQLDVMGEDGVRGTLLALEAEGSLLDAAGQLFGYWVMRVAENDKLAMPIRVRRLSVYGPEPTGGVDVGCTVWVRKLGVRDVSSDMELTHADGSVWARVEGWEDWRFETDGRLWPVMHRTEENLFADITEAGVALVDEPERSSSNIDYLARRFLNEEERAFYHELAPRRQTPWLYGRIAAKDAVRHWLWERGHGPLFPAEIAVRNDDSGRPHVSGPFEEDLRVSIAHKETAAVAMVRDGVDTGVDIERVTAREDGFEALVCTPAEREFLPTAERDVWITRFFCAKEVIGKRRGTGLGGSPKKFVVTEVSPREESEIWLLVDGEWVATRRQGDYVLAWSPDRWNGE